MGRNKALLELGGIPFVVRSANLVKSVVGNVAIFGSPDLYGSLGFDVIGDDWPGCGPLGGIATALRVSHTPWNLIIACDLPYLTKEWLDFLAQRALRSAAEAVIPMNERGAEPLCAMYNKECEQAIRGALEIGTRKVTDSFAALRVEYVERAEWKAFDSEGILFKNMNSPLDYEEAKAKLEGHEKR